MEDTQKKHKLVWAQTLGQFAQSSGPEWLCQETWLGMEEICITSRKVLYQEGSEKDIRREAPNNGELPSSSHWCIKNLQIEGHSLPLREIFFATSSPQVT